MKLETIQEGLNLTAYTSDFYRSETLLEVFSDNLFSGINDRKQLVLYKVLGSGIRPRIPFRLKHTRIKLSRKSMPFLSNC